MSYTKKYSELTRDEKSDVEYFESDAISEHTAQDIDFLKDEVVDKTEREFKYVYCSGIDDDNYSGHLGGHISFNDGYYNEIHAGLKEDGKAYEISLGDCDWVDTDNDSFENDILNEGLIGDITIYCPNGTLETSYEDIKNLANGGAPYFVSQSYFDELFDYHGDRVRSQEVMRDIVNAIEPVLKKCVAEYNELERVVEKYVEYIESLYDGYGDAWDANVEAYFEGAIITYDDDGDIDFVDW